MRRRRCRSKVAYNYLIEETELDRSCHRFEINGITLLPTLQAETTNGLERRNRVYFYAGEQSSTSPKRMLAGESPVSKVATRSRGTKRPCSDGSGPILTSSHLRSSIQIFTVRPVKVMASLRDRKHRIVS